MGISLLSEYFGIDIFLSVKAEPPMSLSDIFIMRCSDTLNLFAIFFEDSIIAVILPSLFLILVSNSNKRQYVAGIFLFVLYLTKTSMFFLTIQSQ